MDPKDPQQQIDFSRSEQLGILRDAILPSSNGRDGGGVKPAAMKMVLSTLDHFGRGRACWPSLDTIATKSCLSLRQTRRAIEGLESLGLLAIERRRFGDRKATGNHYVLIWSELALLCPDRRGNQLAMSSDQLAILGDQLATHGHQTAKKRQEKPPPPDPLKTDPAGGVQDADWAAVVDHLREVGVGLANDTAAAARAQGMTANEVSEIVATYRANRSRLRGPGAIRYRVERGAWPVEGILPAARAKELHAAAARLKREIDVESLSPAERLASYRSLAAAKMKRGDAGTAEQLTAAASERKRVEVLAALSRAGEVGR